MSTESPDLLLDGMVYRKLGVALTWQESLVECEGGGGTLLR